MVQDLELVGGGGGRGQRNKVAAPKYLLSAVSPLGRRLSVEQEEEQRFYAFCTQTSVINIPWAFTV